MALDRPTLKMSKSHPQVKSRILLTDTRAEITKKLRVALTDSIDGVSYDPAERPGVSNLVEIAFHLDPAGADSVQDLAKDFAGISLKALKERVADVVDVHLAPIRERFNGIMSGEQRELDDAAALGAQKAATSAAATMTLVRNAVGL